MLKLNTAILVLLHFLGQDVLHVVHDVPGDVNLVGWQASVGYDPVYPDVPDILHSNSVESRYPDLGVIQLVLLCCFYPERADVTELLLKTPYLINLADLSISSLHIDITEAQFYVGFNCRNGYCYDGSVCMSWAPAVVVTRLS